MPDAIIKPHDKTHESHGDEHAVAGKPILDAKDNAIQRREEDKLSANTKRLTRGDEQSFSIDIRGGQEINDRRLIADKGIRGLTPFERALQELKMVEEMHSKFGADIVERNGKYDYHSNVTDDRFASSRVDSSTRTAPEGDSILVCSEGKVKYCRTERKNSVTNLKEDTRRQVLENHIPMHSGARAI